MEFWDWVADFPDLEFVGSELEHLGSVSPFPLFLAAVKQQSLALIQRDFVWLACRCSVSARDCSASPEARFGSLLMFSMSSWCQRR